VNPEGGGDTLNDLVLIAKKRGDLNCLKIKKRGTTKIQILVDKW